MMNFLELSVELIMPMMIVSVFLFIGIGLLYFPRKAYNERKRRCSTPVEATVVAHDSQYHDGKTLYANIYSFYYNGLQYEVIDSAYTNFAAKEIGTRVQLMINPLNPHELQDTTKFSLIVTTIMGIAFTGIPLMIIISFLSELFG